MPLAEMVLLDRKETSAALDRQELLESKEKGEIRVVIDIELVTLLGIEDITIQ